VTADTERDEKVAAGYRALRSEEPPRALDEAILTAARKRPSQWRVPLSIAAVLVLAVGVTLRMLPQRPEAESVALAPQVMQTPRPAASAPAPARELARPAAGAEAAAEVAAADARAESRMRSDIAAKPTSRASAAPAPPAAGAGAETNVLAGKMAKAELSPQAWLERIAELRKQGRTREAEESLAEFRKRYPDYRIPEPPR
jgi:hypothetical protein